MLYQLQTDRHKNRMREIEIERETKRGGERDVKKKLTLERDSWTLQLEERENENEREINTHTRRVSERD